MPPDITAEDLLLNDIFIEFCLNPSAENAKKWEVVEKDNHIPGQVIAQAQAMLTMLTPGIGKPSSFAITVPLMVRVCAWA